MHIYVDADACPVIAIIENKAQKYNVAVTLLCDTNHVLTSAYSEVVVVGAGADAVDYKLINICQKGDVVVSQDYGVQQWHWERELMRSTSPENGTRMITLTGCLWNGI